MFYPNGDNTKAWHIDVFIYSIFTPTLYKFISSLGFTNVLFFHYVLFSLSIGNFGCPIKSSPYKRWKCKLFTVEPPPNELYPTLILNFKLLNVWKDFENIEQKQYNILSNNLWQLLIWVHCQNAVKRTNWSCID